MPNAFIPRDIVHEWSEQIGADAMEHQSTLQRLLKNQRRLTRFLEENHENLDPMSAGVGLYLFGVVARMFDLAGGRLKSATWSQIRDAEKRVGAQIGELLPVDDEFPARVREKATRAQPHILDEALMALFERTELSEEEANLDKNQAFRIFCLMWVATEVFDENWRPPSSFEGLDAYEYVHIESKSKKD